MTEAWEPTYGFCGINETDRKALAMTLEALRRQVCAYGGGSFCDCKYGLTVDPTLAMGGFGFGQDKGLMHWRYDPQEQKQVRKPLGVGSEATGCPELREIIHRLLHRDQPLV